MIRHFATRMLPAELDVVAPDGSEVRLLLSLVGGSMAHFRLPSGRVSRAVRHRTVEEIWYVLSGTGEMWRSLDDQSEIIALIPGLAVTIPVGTSFQFRAGDPEPFTAIAITMPPWPGEGEAEFVAGEWESVTG